jgi:hypothetical protein
VGADNLTCCAAAATKADDDRLVPDRWDSEEEVSVKQCELIAAATAAAAAAGLQFLNRNPKPQRSSST